MLSRPTDGVRARGRSSTGVPEKWKEGALDTVVKGDPKQTDVT